MSAENQLEQACNHWHRLAVLEGEAIRNREWDRVATCQKTLLELQPLITDYLRHARADWAAEGSISKEREQRFHHLFNQLITLERHNEVLVQEVRRTARTRSAQLQQVKSTLRRLRASYVPPHPERWSCFS